MVFFGSGKFARIVFRKLLDQELKIDLVITSPASQHKDNPADLIAQIAAEHKIPVLKPTDFNYKFTFELEKYKPQVGLLTDFAQIIPPLVLNIFPKKLLALHPSLLPAYRGPAPVQYALLNGDPKTGVTLFIVQESVDTGPIIARKKLNILPDDTAGTLFEKLADLGTKLVVKTLPQWLKGEITPKPQDEAFATLTKKITKEDAQIDWELPDIDIFNAVRAYNPWPVAFTFWERQNKKIRLQILEAQMDPNLGHSQKNKQPGEVFLTSNKEPGVSCGQGALILKKVRFPGKDDITGQDLINGYPDIIGSQLLSE
jgi:methionyl-tRNA formyltransferase